MKKIIITIGVLVSGAVYSQVGIDTETPKATLDVTGKPSDLTKADGIIAPRLKGSELKAKDALYGADQNLLWCMFQKLWRLQIRARKQ
ncbi:hypothetical protein D3C71_07750 [compost metagenome]